MAAIPPPHVEDISVNQQIARQYDEHPYASDAFYFSSPAHLQAVAHLYGVAAIAPERARVLEIGCASGGNILPFALANPDARVVGVDLSALQIEQGQRVVEALGVPNLELRAMDLAAIGSDMGEFDYIIAHGVFSWVPPDVREALLRVCRTNLSANGVAFISYNTYPGWKAGDIVRDAVMLHAHGLSNDQERVEAARAVVRMFNEGVAASNPLRAALATVTRVLDTLPDYYVAHEYLETFNAPCYFVEFVDLATRSGMEYLGEAQPHLELASTYGANVQLNLSLTALGRSKVMRQQYLDFLVGQNFRKSLLVHAERSAGIAVQPDLERLTDLRFSAHFRQVDAPPDSLPGQKWFVDQNGMRLLSDDPAVLSLIGLLSESWPRSIGWDESKAKTVLDEVALRKALEELFRLGRVHLSIGPTPYDRAPAASTPQLIPGVCQLLALMDAGENGHIGLYDLLHRSILWRPSEVDAFVLRLVDGKRKTADLRNELRDAWQRGNVPGPDGKSLVGQRNLDALAQRAVHQVLETLRQKGMLLG